MFLVIGPLCWGKGVTQEQAVRECRKNAPRKGSFYYQPFRYIVYQTTDEKAYVSRDGYLITDGAAIDEVARLPKTRWKEETK